MQEHFTIKILDAFGVKHDTENEHSRAESSDTGGINREDRHEHNNVRSKTDRSQPSLSVFVTAPFWLLLRRHNVGELA